MLANQIEYPLLGQVLNRVGEVFPGEIAELGHAQSAELRERRRFLRAVHPVEEVAVPGPPRFLEEAAERRDAGLVVPAIRCQAGDLAAVPVRVETEHGGERLVVCADRKLVVVEVAPALHEAVFALEDRRREAVAHPVDRHDGGLVEAGVVVRAGRMREVVVAQRVVLSPLRAFRGRGVCSNYAAQIPGGRAAENRPRDIAERLLAVAAPPSGAPK